MKLEIFLVKKEIQINQKYPFLTYNKFFNPITNRRRTHPECECALVFTVIPDAEASNRDRTCYNR